MSGVGWPELELLGPWQPWPLLGVSFLASHSVNDDGYILLLTNGVRGWCEQRTASYVREKADEWTSCVEAEEVQHLGELVLQEAARLAARGDDTKSSLLVNWSEDASELSLDLNSSLEGLPYSWTFHLKSLPQDKVQEIVTIPLLVRVLALTDALKKKQQQVHQLQQKLADLTPDGGKKKQHQIINEEESVALETAAREVVRVGAAQSLATLLTPEVYTALRQHSQGNGSVGVVNPSQPTNRPPPPRQRKTPGLSIKPRAQTSSLKDELLTEADEQARRAEIESMRVSSSNLCSNINDEILAATQTATGAAIAVTGRQPKKKKKLNI